MTYRSSTLPFVTSALLLCPAAFATVRTHRHSSSHAIVRRSAATHATHAGHLAEHTSYGISSERATEIQAALIQHGYLTGQPTGTWDAASAAAMQKMQSDNGWQTKLVPDSRAIIKLGLGPNSTPSGSTAALAPSTSPSLHAPRADQSF